MMQGYGRGRQMPVEPAATIEALLTVNDVAALLRTSARQVRNMRARGQLPAAIRLPGCGLRWTHDALYSWLAGLRGEESP